MLLCVHLLLRIQSLNMQEEEKLTRPDVTVGIMACASSRRIVVSDSLCTESTARVQRRQLLLGSRLRGNCFLLIQLWYMSAMPTSWDR